MFFGSLNTESIAHSNGKNPHITMYKYCGIVSSFTLYPASNKVTIAIIVEPYEVIFDTIISYSVIDSHKIISYEGKRTKSIAPITLMKLLSTGLYLLKYQIEVERYERINIICNISQYYFINIFDGPGTLYNILKPFEGNEKMAHYTTTTFQSFVFLVRSQFEVSNSIFIAYNTSMSNKAQKELSNSEISMIKMDTEAQLFFKITIYQMEYTGIKYSSCGYDGITLYDINGNGRFQKISTACYSNELEYRYKNLYTENSVMLLVLYSYKKYSNISLNLSVSTSECKAKTINICELKHDKESLESTSFFSVKKQKCIIIQLHYRQGNISLLELQKGISVWRSDIYSVFKGSFFVIRK